MTRDMELGQQIEDEYALPIRVWAAAHGRVVLDMSLAQLARFRAWEAALHDTDAAPGLLYGRMLYATGRISP